MASNRKNLGIKLLLLYIVVWILRGTDSLYRDGKLGNSSGMKYFQWRNCSESRNIFWAHAALRRPRVAVTGRTSGVALYRFLLAAEASGNSTGTEIFLSGSYGIAIIVFIQYYLYKETYYYYRLDLIQQS